MFKHHKVQREKPKRVVVLGAQGFVGRAAIERLQPANIPVLSLSRKEVDLLNPQASFQLAELLQSDDSLLIAAAQAPCKNNTMLVNNILMMQNICEALSGKSLRQVIYVSSDAVYADSLEPLTEASITVPTALHGMMHLAREMMLHTVVKAPLAFLRPSLLYGIKDPHNGYGPNQFRRLVAKGEPIVLFGNGEEKRDHVYIDDVAELIYLALCHQSEGVLNVASGEVNSFLQIAEKINALSDAPVEIHSRPRSQPMPHNGYRSFDNTMTQQAFPHFNYTRLAQGLKIVAEKEREILV